jgi:Mrp family chromosome partitioning ATPase/capsular polysaccharide biosynthesis protein
VQEDHRPATDLRELLWPLWSRRWLVIGVVAVVTLATLVWSATRPKRYTATTSIFLQSARLDQALAGVAAPPSDDRTVENQARLLRARDVAVSVARQIGFRGSPGALLANLEAAPVTGADFVKVTFTANSPKTSAAGANAFADAFIAIRRGRLRSGLRETRREAKREIRSAGKTPEGLATRADAAARIRRIDILLAVPSSTIEQVNRAEPPTSPSSPRTLRTTLFAAAIALVLALVLAYLLSRMDRRLRRVEDISSAFGYPVLATLPHVKDEPTTNGASPALPEALKEPFRSLRANIQLAALDRPITSVLVTSGLPEEGKSTVVRNLALVYREAGASVAVIELDLRRPVLSGLLGVERAPGVTDVLLGQATLSGALQRIGGSEGARGTATALEAGDGGPVNGHRRMPPLEVLTSGEAAANPPGVLAARAVKDLIEEVGKMHDVVLIDSPPLLAVSDAVPLLDAVDGTLLVTRLGLVTRDVPKRLRDLFTRVPHVNVLGVAVNDVPDDDFVRGPYAEYGYADRR